MHNVIDVYNQTVHEPATGSSEESVGRSRAASDPTSWQAPRSWNPVEGQEMCWKDYVEVNRTFADRVVETWCEGDLIWIQHYHFMLLPSYLARKLPSCTPIGIFIHEPFPSSEIWCRYNNTTSTPPR